MISKFAEKESEILKFWQENKIFEKSMEKKAPKGDYVFYDGPPFATGTPHYGHIVASLMKDVVPRFWTMNGFNVKRRWGWDCHGLPVENLVEKELELETKKDIEEKIGVCGFNDACRNSVMKYADVWKKFIPRMGRWVDMEDDYKTLDINYMESIWWVFKTLYGKGLIYEGFKAMHICPRCNTTLSNFEVTQNYKDITDISVIAKFELADEPNTFILAWTTTPWTLPGNVALAMGEKIEYVLVRDKKQVTNDKYILAKANIDKIFAGIEYEILGKVKAKDLIGKKYRPLFDYFLDANLASKENLYTIQLADFVTVEDGTGVVHIAPGFGEDDLNLGRQKNLPTIIHVNAEGKFTEEVKDFSGQPVKLKEDPQATDKKIIENLEKKNLVIKSEQFSHSYPHCWRCDTPLLNYATSSWFVRVTDIKKDLVKNNKKVNWVPAYLKEGRFGKWLEGSQDWAISRQRYWGSTIPVWKCENKDCGNIEVAGSIEELQNLSGQKISDLHKHVVDEIIFPCKKCQGEMKRIPDVLDCWFESGSMPYAQIHYPFENKEWFENNFPAEFIAEGVDQTRGWFYTLMVLSTALFNKPAFENVIANGIVLAPSGQKMSKRLKNYPEPDLIIDQFGADAMRYYLLTSPVMAAETLNFSETGVKESLQKVIMLIGNVLSFYLMYANDGNKREYDANKAENILDKWILAKLNMLNQEVTEAMKKYDLVKATRPLGDFINELSTWYLRRSRERFKAGDQEGINILGFVLQEFSKIAAPFIPFIAEDIYRQSGGQKESVHLETWPAYAKASAGDARIIEQINLVRQIVEKGLAARSEANIKIRQPLSELRIKSYELSGKDELLDLIKDEINVKEVVFDEKIEKEVELDLNMTEELKQEGLMRELVRQINQLRKEAGLTINDKVIIYHDGLDEVFTKFGQEIKKATLAEKLEKGSIDFMKDLEGGRVGIRKV